MIQHVAGGVMTRLATRQEDTIATNYAVILDERATEPQKKKHWPTSCDRYHIADTRAEAIGRMQHHRSGVYYAT